LSARRDAASGYREPREVSRQAEQEPEPMTASGPPRRLMLAPTDREVQDHPGDAEARVRS
jgi:hypothetical protein